ncbi:MAG: hypothetical protein ABW360_10715, partial [Phenylobacterium sp.]
MPLSQANPLKSLLDQAGIGKDSLIRVTGPSGLSALLWLCRRGYDRVGYVRPGQGCPHEEPDALLVAHTCDAACLGRLLATGPYVREGGVLIFRSPQPDRAGPGGDPIHRILERGGYAVERCLHGAHRELHVAR